MDDGDRNREQYFVPYKLPHTIDDLLTDSLSGNPSWEYSIGRQKSFYIRGATWFVGNVLRTISDLQKMDLGDQPRAILTQRISDASSVLDLDGAFSPRQAMSALSMRSRSPLRVEKAVLTIALCEAVLKQKREQGLVNLEDDEVWRRMRVQPAVFYISDFDSVALEELRKSEPQILERLRAMTDQRSRVVFGEMAFGHTVTRQLAEKTRAALVELFPTQEFGYVESRFYPGMRSAAPTEVLND